MSRGPKDDYILQKAAARGGEVRCTLLSQAERCTASTHPALQQLPRALAQRHWQDSGARARKLLCAQRRGRVRKQVSLIPVFTDTGTLSSAGCNSFWPLFFFQFGPCVGYFSLHLTSAIYIVVLLDKIRPVVFACSSSLLTVCTWHAPH